MSAYETKAFVVEAGFGPATRQNPALVFAEEAVKFFDSREHSSLKEWVADDYFVGLPDGERQKGSAEEQFDAAKQLYDKLLTAHRHILSSIVAVDTEKGYKIMGHGFMYGNLLAASTLKSAKVSGPDGSKWDLAVPVFGEFDIVKDANAKHHGLLLKQGKFTIGFDIGQEADLFLERRRGHD